MKQAFLAAIAIATSMFFKPPGGYVIKGRIDGAKNGLKVYLGFADIKGKDKFFDSTILTNGQFEFKGNFPSPRFCSVIFKDPKGKGQYTGKALNLFVGDGKMTVKAIYDSLPSEFDAMIGSFCMKPSIKVSGSPAHDQLMDFVNGLRPLNDRLEWLDDSLGKVYSASPKEPAAFQARMALAQQIDQVYEELKSLSLSFIAAQEPGEVTGLVAYKTLSIESLDTKEVGLLQSKFAAMTPKGPIVSALNTAAEQAGKTAVGSNFHDFSFKDSSGVLHQLGQYIGKGKYVLVDCWASWCGPCRKDIPHLKEVYRDYHEKGFEIISVSLDENADQWKKALREEKMPWLQVSENKGFEGGIVATYKIRGIPTCFLFDPQGKLVTKNMRGPWMDNRLIALYGALPEGGSH
ncbi:TlpA disulfide reductase family protein [Paraflavitalea sp. CAU 1676]|uniref:TlpA disulfide reductase family protein n=1 Tax=Paraflavitalea sp. CAU 1676 TaxID=3032598 RepID=UPI0023D9C8D1|nr:TlpA disulfide reductase family protein [Paraflavitalea sp. CAU 1676]MDF2188007.1 TlpA disulfide reductase family protein [Paraflavitalea sp. CAU 1676]